MAEEMLDRRMDIVKLEDRCGQKLNRRTAQWAEHELLPATALTAVWCLRCGRHRIKEQHAELDLMSLSQQQRDSEVQNATAENHLPPHHYSDIPFFTRGVGLLQIQTLNEIVTSRSASLAGLHAQLTSLSCALTRGDAECRSLRVSRTALQMR